MTLIQHVLSCLAVVGTVQASLTYNPVLVDDTISINDDIERHYVTIRPLPTIDWEEIWAPIRPCPRRVCYFTNWSRHGAGVTFPSNDFFSSARCTHIIVARARLREVKGWHGEYNLAFEIDPLTEQQLKLLKKVRKVKALLSVGLTVVSSRMALALTSDFVDKYIIKELRKLGFDGLDWYYPASFQTPLEDKQNFNLLIKSMRSFLKKDAKVNNLPKVLLMTATLPADKKTVNSGFDIPSLGRDLDFVNLMTYDIWEDSDVRWRHISPLWGHPDKTREHNLEFYVENWIAKGFPKDKTVVGLPAFGSSFNVANMAHGYVTYNKVCEMINDGASVKRLGWEKVPYLTHGTTLVTYDDTRSATYKVGYIKANRYGGIMVKSLNAFNTTACEPRGDPVLDAVIKACE